MRQRSFKRLTWHMHQTLYGKLGLNQDSGLWTRIWLCWISPSYWSTWWTLFRFDFIFCLFYMSCIIFERLKWRKKVLYTCEGDYVAMTDFEINIQQVRVAVCGGLNIVFRPLLAVSSRITTMQFRFSTWNIFKRKKFKSNINQSTDICYKHMLQI